MEKNHKKINNIKETEVLKNEENSLNSPTELTEQNPIQDEKKNDININIPTKKERKDKFKFKEHYLNKGNVHMFCFNKNGIPKIVIGPHCKN